jgi:RimJ/RimL family protein N-acetyltransferase
MYTVWTGARVRLRPFKDADEWAQMYKELHRESNAFWGPGWRSCASLKKDYEDYGMLEAGKECAFCVESVANGEVVGVEYCGPSSGVPSICGWVGTFILRPHWSNGYGIEAKQLALCFLFENFPYHRVDACTVANHKRAAAGLHNSGMKFEGRIRGYQFQDGVFHDIVNYRILRHEWEQLPIRQIVQRG